MFQISAHTEKEKEDKHFDKLPIRLTLLRITSASLTLKRFLEQLEDEFWKNAYL